MKSPQSKSPPRASMPENAQAAPATPTSITSVAYTPAAVILAAGVYMQQRQEKLKAENRKDSGWTD